MSETDPASRSRPKWTLAAVCVATFMLLMDITIVNVGLPSIQRDLDASLTGLQWVVDAYALSLAALLLTSGVLADRFGRRRLFAGGVTVFTAASLACGLAGSATMLDIARAIQGIGGAAMFATSLALIAQEFTGAQRGAAIALWGSTIGAAVAAGPLIGGALTQALAWRWIFFVNVPIGVLAITVAMTRVADQRAPHAGRIDLGGLVSFSTALFLLVFGLLRGNAAGWGSAQIVASIAGGLVLLTAFVAIERRVANPMFDLGLFGKPAFVGVSVATFAIGAGMFAMFLYLSIYLQGILGYGPLGAGLRFLPTTLLVLVVPLLTRRLAQRMPARVMLGTGLLCVSLGLLLMHGVQVDSGWTTLLAGLLVAGVGIGLANPSIASTAIGVVPRERSGMASGINNTFRMGGLATGVAALGAIFQHQIAGDLGAHSQIAGAVASGGTRALGAQVSGALASAADQAFIGALNDILMVGALVTLVGGVAAWTLVRSRDFVPMGAPVAAAQGEAGAG